MKRNIEIDQLQQLLEVPIAQAVPRPAWKREFMSNLVAMQQAPITKRWRWVWPISLATTVMAVIGVFLIFPRSMPLPPSAMVGSGSQADHSESDVIASEKGPEHLSVTPFYIPTQWEREHVQYAFADDQVVPQLPQYQSISPAFDRNSLDVIATAIDPDFLHQPVTETENSITYQTNEHSLYFELVPSATSDQTPVVHFEFTLFTPPQGKNFAQENEIHRSHQDQQAMVKQAIQTYSGLFTQTIGSYLFDAEAPRDQEVLSLLLPDTKIETYYQGAATIRFYNGEIQSISGIMISNVEQTGTAEFGTTNEIQHYLDATVDLSTKGDWGDVDLRYILSKPVYVLSSDGPYLMVNCVLDNADETLQALGTEQQLSELNQLRHYQRIIPLLTQQAQQMDYIAEQLGQ